MPGAPGVATLSSMRNRDQRGTPGRNRFRGTWRSLELRHPDVAVQLGHVEDDPVGTHGYVYVLDWNGGDRLPLAVEVLHGDRGANRKV